MFDPIAVLEASYRRADDLEGWFRAVVTSISPALDRGLGMCGYTVDLAARRIDQFFDFGAHPGARAFIEDGASRPERFAAIQAVDPAGLYSSNEVFGVIAHPRGEDSLALSIPSGEASLRVIIVESPRHEVIEPEARLLWGRIALHLAAGARVQRHAGTVDDPEVEAVLAPDGRLLHSIDDIDVDERAQLRALALEIERLRSRRDAGADDALEIWQGLLLGRWSLVDQFDTDGRRFLVARRNDPDPPGPRTLTRRQRQVAFYAGLGMANPQIAYALGLPEPTIAAELAAALAHLGLRSRGELVQLAARLGSANDAG